MFNRFNSSKTELMEVSLFEDGELEKFLAQLLGLFQFIKTDGNPMGLTIAFIIINKRRQFANEFRVFCC